MSDLHTWLAQFGLAEYAQAFEENAVDLRALPELNEADLKELGLKLGHRRILQKAIAELGDSAELPLAPIAQAPDEPTTATPINSNVEPERRQLTVMFCDLVGSVELGESMELEAYRDLLAKFTSLIVGAVEQFDGFVARHQGDGLLAYFGYPTARENDAERAVRAGLEIVSAVGALRSTEESAHVRVGIATGHAIVGDRLSTGAAVESELAAFGATPNLAARLQGAAQADEVLISATTAQLVNASFATQADTFELKGFATSVNAYRVLELANPASRLDVTSGRKLTPLVGREEELALLGKRWQQAQFGDGQAVLVSAEPGVGKTRLMMEVHRRFNSSAGDAVLMFCSPYHTGSPLHPVIDYLLRDIGLDRVNTAYEQIGAIETWLETLQLSPAGLLPLLAPLFGLEPTEKYARAETGGTERARQTLQALIDIVAARCKQGPVVIAIEDLHWIDATTIEFIGQLLDFSRDHQVFLLLTHRPEFDPPWRSQPHVTNLTLNHLTGRECRELVRGIGLDATLPDEVIEQIIARTDGVPLYVEEILRSVAEADETDVAAIPATLRDALTARLDRLGASKRTAQLAATIGRVFALPLLNAASEDGVPLAADLEKLVESGLVYQRTLSGESEFAFKHALIRDSAYQSLLRQERERLHSRVAQALIASPERVSLAPDLVARHLQEGARPHEALPYWRRAGAESTERGAYHEALRHLEAATVCLEAVHCDGDEAIEVAIDRARCLHFLGRRMEALAAFDEIEAAIEQCADLRLAGSYFELRGRVQAFQGQREASLASFQRAIDAAKACGDTMIEGNAHAWIARDMMLTDDPSGSEQRMLIAIEKLRENGPSWELGEAYFRFGLLTAYLLAQFDRTLALSKELHTIADQLGDTRIRYNGYLVQGVAELGLGDANAAEASLKRSLSAAPNDYDRVFGEGALVQFYVDVGDGESASKYIDTHLERIGKFRSQHVRGIALCRAANTFRLLGDLERAQGYAEQALALASSLNMGL